MSLITLLTDFGTTDSYVAEIKGEILRGAPGTTLVDLSHAVPPGDVRSAAYLLGRTWHHFPTGAVHLGVVDPGVGTNRAAMAFSAHGHWFVGPDNGLFTPVLHDAEVEIVALPVPEGASPTFHGRDLFAPAAAALAQGVALSNLGPPFDRMPERLAYTV
ncbi:MAG: SAM hydrolase/SAM-dependent halogenase family protein, partial [Gemmatimonadales bacterium]